jgi:uncharacterized protein (TIGR00730 family)
MNHKIQSVAVFCGTRIGQDPAHFAAAQQLGKGLARAGITLVYGGGGIGLMRAVADAVLAEGGHVHGVIPDFLARIEHPHPGIDRLDVTNSMHARKQRMSELADAFITLSGGLGTLDETFEIMTWRQLGLHEKPIIVLDIAGWAKPFLALVDAVIAAGFAAPESRDLFQVAADVPAALRLLGCEPNAKTIKLHGETEGTGSSGKGRPRTAYGG